MGDRRRHIDITPICELPKDERAVFVTILCDSGDKYLSERFWEEGNS